MTKSELLKSRNAYWEEQKNKVKPKMVIVTPTHTIYKSSPFTFIEKHVTAGEFVSSRMVIVTREEVDYYKNGKDPIWYQTEQWYFNGSAESDRRVYPVNEWAEERLIWIKNNFPIIKEA